jgi:hypothetical protein
MQSPFAILTLAIPLLLAPGAHADPAPLPSAIDRTQHELRATIEQLGTAEQTDFYPLTGDVDPLVNHVVSARDLLTRARVTVDGGERIVAAAGPASVRAPGPE